jgi:hypothetical protein
MRRTALIAFLLGLAAILVFELVPWLGRKRDFPAEIPNPPALQVLALDVVPAGKRLCMREIAIERHARQVRFQVGTYFKPGPPLLLEITAPGYRSASRVAAGYPDNARLSLPVKPPPRDTLVTACFTNLGRRKIAFYAATDRAVSRAQVTLGGKPVEGSPAFGFWEGRSVSIADRADVTVERMATFRGFLGHAWLLWALLVMFVLGMPAALAVALWRGFPR